MQQHFEHISTLWSRLQEDPRGNAKAKLILQLEALKQSSGGTKPTASDGDVPGSSVLYELLMKPEASKLEEQTRVAEIEQRLERLEKALGSAPDKMVNKIIISRFYSSIFKRQCSYSANWSQIGLKKVLILFTGRTEPRNKPKKRVWCNSVSHEPDVPFGPSPFRSC